MRFMISLIALIGLQGSVCASACLAITSSISATFVAQDLASTEPACHDSGEPAQDPSDSDAECTCCTTLDAVPGKTVSTARSNDSTPAIASTVVFRPLPPPAHREFVRLDVARIPPPDILLLKSILII
ncbi:MAG: hypothetical protein GY725_23920 [bacterium]|nr:hypothetical protein [bacterium]